MDVLDCNEPAGCVATWLSEGYVAGHDGCLGDVKAPPRWIGLPVPAAKVGQLTADAVQCSSWQAAAHLVDEQSSALPGSLLRHQGLAVAASCTESVPQSGRQGRSAQQRQQVQLAGAQQAAQQGCQGSKAPATLSAEELNWLCTILPEGRGSCSVPVSDSASWLADAQAAAALLRPEVSAASSTAQPPPTQLLWLRQLQIGPHAMSRLPSRISPLAGAAQVPWPGSMLAPSSSLPSNGGLPDGSSSQLIRAQLAVCSQPGLGRSAEWQSAQLSAYLPAPAPLAGLPASPGGAVPASTLSTLAAQPAGGSPAKRTEGGGLPVGPSSEAHGRASGPGCRPTEAPRGRRFGSRYSDADLEVLKAEDPGKWRRIMTNRKVRQAPPLSVKIDY